MKKVWIKPECKKIKLVPEEAVLARCKRPPSDPFPCVNLPGPPTRTPGS